jgi:hypothetical protein
MIKPASHEFDGRALVTIQETGYVGHIAKRFLHDGIFELLKKRSRKTYVQTGYVLEAFKHSRDAIVAPEDLFGFPGLLGTVKPQQIAPRLVHMESQRVVDLGHGLFLSVPTSILLLLRQLNMCNFCLYYTHAPCHPEPVEGSFL